MHVADKLILVANAYHLSLFMRYTAVPVSKYIIATVLEYFTIVVNGNYKFGMIQ